MKSRLRRSNEGLAKSRVREQDGIEAGGELRPYFLFLPPTKQGAKSYVKWNPGCFAAPVEYTLL